MFCKVQLSGNETIFRYKAPHKRIQTTGNLLVIFYYFPTINMKSATICADADTAAVALIWHIHLLRIAWVAHMIPGNDAKWGNFLKIRGYFFNEHCNNNGRPSWHWRITRKLKQWTVAPKVATGDCVRLPCSIHGFLSWYPVSVINVPTLSYIVGIHNIGRTQSAYFRTRETCTTGVCIRLANSNMPRRSPFHPHIRNRNQSGSQFISISCNFSVCLCVMSKVLFIYLRRLP